MSEFWKRVKEKDAKSIMLVLTALLAAVYFFAMLRFYLIDYYVPDFRLYQSFAAQGLKAKDGFSSLFILLAGLSGLAPKVVTVGCLLLLALSIYNIMLFYWRCFYTSWENYAIVLLITFSCGCWYYFYGKIFYDFPLSIYTFSLGLVFFSHLLESQRNAYAQWCVVCGLMGLCLSWKPYNIFMIAGLGLLLLAHDRGRMVLKWHFFASIRKVMGSVCAFALGYVIGNFNLLVSPRETLTGIRAYDASYSFWPFILGKNRIIWDHVNDEAFHLSVFCVVIAVTLLFVMPVLLKKVRYVFVAIFMTACLYLYITHFSPGYTWHGLPFGVFIILFAMFLLDGVKMAFDPKCVVLCFSIITQIVTCFMVYLPNEVRWHDTTQEAIHVLEENEDRIYGDTQEIIDSLGDSTFMVDIPIKRFAVFRTKALGFNAMGLHYPYVVNNNIEFVNPLEKTDYKSWKDLYKNSRYNGNPNEAEYVIYIMPDCFWQMSDVANVYIYEGREIAMKVTGNGYAIYVYRNS